MNDQELVLDSLLEKEQDDMNHDEQLKGLEFAYENVHVIQHMTDLSTTNKVKSLSKPVHHNRGDNTTRVLIKVNECDWTGSHDDQLNIYVEYDPHLDAFIWKITEGEVSFSDKDTERTLFTGSFTSLCDRLVGKE